MHSLRKSRHHSRLQLKKISKNPSFLTHNVIRVLVYNSKFVLLLKKFTGGSNPFDPSSRHLRLCHRYKNKKTVKFPPLTETK